MLNDLLPQQCTPVLTQVLPPQTPQQCKFSTVLDMFDPEALPLIRGVNIDSAKNALTLTSPLHSAFDRFEIGFRAKEDGPPNTYDVIAYDDCFSASFGLPVTTTLSSTIPTAPVPSPILLKIRHSVANILRLTAAGEYIDSVLRDMEAPCLPADGSADIGCMISAKISGWLQEVASSSPELQESVPPEGL